MVYDTLKCEQYIHQLLQEYHYEKEYFMVPLHLIVRLVDFVTGFFNQTNDVLQGISDELNAMPSSVTTVVKL